MQTHKKSQNHQGYQIHTSQRAGLSCSGYQNKLDYRMAECATDTDNCKGMSNEIKCMLSACDHTATPCML